MRPVVAIDRELEATRSMRLARELRRAGAAVLLDQVSNVRIDAGARYESVERSIEIAVGVQSRVEVQLVAK